MVSERKVNRYFKTSAEYMFSCENRQHRIENLMMM